MSYVCILLQQDLRTLSHTICTAETTLDIPKTIVFSHTKDDVYKVYSLLNAESKKAHSVSMYHASQSEETKKFIQATFKPSLSELRCLSATIAFGMVCSHLLFCICISLINLP